MIVFLGGVHGVGKTSMCDGASEKYGLKVFSASAIIRAEREYPSEDSRTAVSNLGGNQQALIRGVQRLFTHADENYLLDGHFALRTLAGNIEEIDVNVFRSMRVNGLICLVDEPEAISQRLVDRDGGIQDVHAIAQLQAAELSSARLVGSTLGLPLHVVSAFDRHTFDECMKALLDMSA